MSHMKGIERAIKARKAKQSANASQMMSPAPVAKPKLTDEEIQAYIDMMLDATKPKVDRTMEILLERFPPNQL